MAFRHDSSTSSQGMSHQLRLSTLYQNGLDSPKPSLASKASTGRPGSSRTRRTVANKLPKSRSRRAVEKILRQRLVKKLRNVMIPQQKSLTFKVNSVGATGSTLSRQSPPAQPSNRASSGSTILVTHPTHRGQNRQTILFVANDSLESATARLPEPETAAPNTRFTLPVVNQVISPVSASATTTASEWEFERGDTPLTADFPGQVNPTRIASVRASNTLDIAESHNRLDGVRGQNVARVDVRMSHAEISQNATTQQHAAAAPQIPYVAKAAPLTSTGLEEPAQYYADQNDRRRTQHLAALSALEGGSEREIRSDSTGSMPGYLAEYGVQVLGIKPQQQQTQATDSRKNKGKRAAEPHVQDELDAVRQATNPADARPALINGPQAVAEDDTYFAYRSGVTNLIPQPQDRIQLGGQRSQQDIRQSQYHADHYKCVEQMAIETHSNTSASVYSQSTCRQSAAVPPLTPGRPMPHSVGSLQRKPLPSRQPSAASSTAQQPSPAVLAARAASGMCTDSTYSAYKHPRPAPPLPVRRAHVRTESSRMPSVVPEDGYPTHSRSFFDAQALGQMSSDARPLPADRPLPPPLPPPAQPRVCYTDDYGTHHVNGCRCSRIHGSSSNNASASSSRQPFLSSERKEKLKNDIIVLITKQNYRKPMWQIALENDARAERKAKRKAEKKAAEAKRAQEIWELEAARYAEARKLRRQDID